MLYIEFNAKHNLLANYICKRKRKNCNIVVSINRDVISVLCVISS